MNVRKTDILFSGGGGASGVSTEVRNIAVFIATKISKQPIDWNPPTWLLRREMRSNLIWNSDRITHG